MDNIAYLPKERRLVFLCNRFCWELSETENAALRVQSALRIENIVVAKNRKLPIREKDHILSFLALSIQPDEKGGANILVAFSGEATIQLEVELVDIFLEDLSQPWKAKSQPHHELLSPPDKG